MSLRSGCLRKQQAASFQAELRYYIPLVTTHCSGGEKNPQTLVIIFFSFRLLSYLPPTPPPQIHFQEPPKSEVQKAAVSAGAFTPLTLLLYTLPYCVPPLWPAGQLKHATVDSPHKIKKPLAFLRQTVLL